MLIYCHGKGKGFKWEIALKNTGTNKKSAARRISPGQQLYGLCFFLFDFVNVQDGKIIDPDTLEFGKCQVYRSHHQDTG